MSMKISVNFLASIAMFVQLRIAANIPELNFSTSPATFTPQNWCRHRCYGDNIEGSELMSYAGDADYVPNLYGGAWKARRTRNIDGKSGVLSIYFTISGNLEDKFHDMKTLKFVSFQKQGDPYVAECYSSC